MKNYFKIFAALSIIAFFVSCSGDDGDPDVNDLQNVDFAFSSTEPPVDESIITNLQSSSDLNALQISGQLAIANAMTAWLGFFEAPAGATTSDLPISSCGGVNTLVYTYTDPSFGTAAIAYQICETADKYIFQIFVSENGIDFDELLYAEESKAATREGLMRIFAVDPTSPDITSTAYITYEWEERADGSFRYTTFINTDGTKVEIIINVDGSGSLSVAEDASSISDDGVLTYSATWNASGTSGTYTEYTDGVATGGGNWPS